MVGDRSVGDLRQTYYTNSTNDQRFYTLIDHLGSIQAVIGADGRKLQSLSFSAWGERRAADWNPSTIGDYLGDAMYSPMGGCEGPQ